MIMKTPFVWLGSKRAAKRGVGEKGALLDQAARARLPVPNGGILLHEFYELLLEAGIVRVDDARVVIDHPAELYEALYTAVRFPRLSTETAVRAAFSTPDGLPPSCPPQLHVNADDAAMITTALCAVWQTAQPYLEVRRDVIIQEMVAAQTAGMALSRQAVADDQVTLLRRSGVDRETAAMLLPKLRLFAVPDGEAPLFAQRLQMLLRGVRRTLEESDWVIEWVDDGEICWLVQVRQADADGEGA